MPSHSFASSVVILVAACGSIRNSVDDQFTHTVFITVIGDGTVNSTPNGISCAADCSEAFAEGTTVTLTPAPNKGSVFVGWAESTCSGAGACSIAVVQDVFLQAVFAFPNTVVVTRAGSGAGIVTSTPPGINCPSDCDESYAPNQTVTLTAIADHESNFIEWAGGGCIGTTPCPVTTAMPVAVNATFALKRYDVSVSKSGNGNGTVISTAANIACGDHCTASVDSGTIITLVATAATGSTFTGWIGADCSGIGSCNVTVTAGTMITAGFALNQYALDVDKAGNGSGTVASAPGGIACGTTCNATFGFGTNVTLMASPTTGSTFSGWSGVGCTGTGTCVVPIIMATRVTATFSATLACTTVNNAFTCTNAGIPEISLSGLAGAACHDQCQLAMAAHGMTSGCWLSSGTSCFCRSGVLNGGGSNPGGTCSQP
jgi:hypothetical protein